MKDSFVHLDEENFEKEVASGVTLVDFHANWCGPCRMLTPILEELVSELEGKARIAKIDIDTAQTVSSTLNVTSIPTLILFSEGKEVGRLVGLRDKETIKAFITAGVSG